MLIIIIAIGVVIASSIFVVNVALHFVSPGPVMNSELYISQFDKFCSNNGGTVIFPPGPNMFPLKCMMNTQACSDAGGKSLVHSCPYGIGENDPSHIGCPEYFECEFSGFVIESP